MKPVIMVKQTAGALSTPWQTQCNESMPWSGKRGLINLVYLRFLDKWMVNCWVPVLLIQAVVSQYTFEILWTLKFESSMWTFRTLRVSRRDHPQHTTSDLKPNSVYVCVLWPMIYASVLAACRLKPMPISVLWMCIDMYTYIYIYMCVCVYVHVFSIQYIYLQACPNKYE